MLQAVLPLLCALCAHAQLFPGLTLPPSGGNQKAASIQHIGPVEVRVDYSSPAVHGPDGKDRRGQIWGKLVPYGLSDLGFGSGKPAPWRAGANENTVFAVSDEVLVEGKPLPAGRYGLHMIPGAETWTVILSRDADAWGSYWYDESRDALRVEVKPRTNSYREWLTYDFTTRRGDEATLELQWEELAVPVRLKVDRIADQYVARLKRDLQSVPGFHHKAYAAAAQYCVAANTQLEQALQWAEAAVAMPGIGVANFETLSTKAAVLAKLGRSAESASTVKQALGAPDATALQIHQYARQLLADKKYPEALAAFQLNQTRFGDQWPVHVGLARGYSATGDLTRALEHARKALAQAPDEVNRKSLASMIETLAQGKPITQ